MARRARRTLTSAIALLAALGGAQVVASIPAVAATSTSTAYAPLDRPGPRLTVSADDLEKSLSCHGDFRGSKLEPVLLDPATGVTPDENYSWNWERAFAAQGRPWCTVTEPFHTLGDLQVGGEYIVNAIRHIHALAGRKVAVMGHSQGGMSMRWALRFWPDTRAMVDDVIGMAGDNHGTTLINAICVEGFTTCTAQGWQQRSTSAYVKAMNSLTETFPGISYTEIYSHTDEVVTPSTGAHPSSALTGPGRITNVATQSICPLDVYEHLTVGTVDPVTYALTMDALTHDGPAVPSRISKATCFQLLMPGVDPTDLQDNLKLVAGIPNVVLVAVPFLNLVGAPQLAKEPELRCYVYAAGCK